MCNNTKWHNSENKMSSSKRRAFVNKEKRKIKDFSLLHHAIYICNLQLQLIQFYIFDRRYYLNELIANKREGKRKTVQYRNNELSSDNHPNAFGGQRLVTQCQASTKSNRTTGSSTCRVARVLAKR